MSEYGWNVTCVSAWVYDDVAVLRAGEWQLAQPMVTNRWRPVATWAAVTAVVPIVNGAVAGVGGADSSIARSKLMRSEDRSETVCPEAGLAVKSVLSSGVGLMSKQPARLVEPPSRSSGKLTFETPCSTL